MRKLALAALAALLLSAAACGSGSGGGGSEATPSDCVDLSTQGSSFTVRMSGMAFHPACFTASASQSLTLVNEDSSVHSFTVEGTPIDIDVAPGQTLHLDPIEGQVQPGTYDLICKYHLPGMTGRITIAGPIPS
jgi:plastocyanin